MNHRVYKIEPLMNNSFSETFIELISYLKSEFQIENIEYIKSELNPDGITFIDFNGISYSTEKPKHMFLTINHVEPDSWTNSGGYHFCTCTLHDKSKLLINYDTSTNVKSYSEIDNKFLRKIKLKNISNV